MPENAAFPQLRQRAEALAEAGNLDDAVALLERAVELGRTRLAEGDPELLTTMRQLAGLHLRADDPMSARRVLEEALEARQRAGAPDQLTLLLAYDLAVVAQELANRHVARTNFATVAEYGPEVLGADHPAVVQARTYLEPETPATDPAPPATVPVPPRPARPDVPVSAPVPVPPPASVSAPAVPSASSSNPASASVSVPAVPPAPFSQPASVAVPAAALAPGARPEPALERRQPTAAQSRRTWVLAGVTVLSLTVAVAAVFARLPGGSEPAEAGQTALVEAPPVSTASSSPIAPASAAPASAVPPAPASLAVSGPAPAATTPRTRAVTPTVAAARTTAATSRTTAATARTRIVAPANNSTVPWPFDARFTVSAADAAATGTVVSLSICVAGRCYLDGKLNVYGNGVAPYTVYLGSTKPEGTGVAWSLRLDRIAKGTYDRLVAERNAAIADGTWGDKGTRMGALNPAPVSTLTVTKGG
ncbi:tetratricopeptide repeat protein [Actinoplanes utahensis]|uniref:tetratricopeptide repeat protein n=1 Tax=Actinoplanes utahensis TaxID=1869 RepID=UPI000AB2A870|nr:tetratricopeptide repeat protein [Actinoplanes utahensis]GIF35540.1 hypothetical protein Aut01nite_85260 [Actinoplanes utahensis]